MVQEQTIREPISFSGIGLHSGVAVKMRILPATAGSGVTFRRSDLEGFDIQAVGRNVAKVSYATSLMRRGVLISTTEHVLSALMGAGIDNAKMELLERRSDLDNWTAIKHHAVPDEDAHLYAEGLGRGHVSALSLVPR